jgi:hypothetical protein
MNNKPCYLFGKEYFMAGEFQTFTWSLLMRPKAYAVRCPRNPILAIVCRCIPHSLVPSPALVLLPASIKEKEGYKHKKCVSYAIPLSTPHSHSYQQIIAYRYFTVDFKNKRHQHNHTCRGKKKTNSPSLLQEPIGNIASHSSTCIK